MVPLKTVALLTNASILYMRKDSIRRLQFYAKNLMIQPNQTILVTLFASESFVLLLLGFPFPLISISTLQERL
jgi:hypothetical protein